MHVATIAVNTESGPLFYRSADTLNKHAELEMGYLQTGSESGFVPEMAGKFYFQNR